MNDSVPPMGPATPPPAQPYMPQPAPAQPTVVVSPPQKPTPFKRMLSYVGCLVFVISLIVNFYLMIAIASMSGTAYIPNVIQQGSENEKVVIFDVEGVLDNKASKKFAKFHQAVRNDKTVQAIVLRVSSPGGTVAASEQIHHMIEDLKAQGKTVVVAMSGVAASGGYMISAPAEEIFIEPSTITGSIGVIAQVPNVEGTLKKIGVEMYVYKSSHAKGWKDQMSIFRKPDNREKKRLIEILDTMQDQFESMVRSGRGDRLKTHKEKYKMTVGTGKDTKSYDIVETAPFNGKIYLADEAIELGLVDKKGYVEDAAKRAAELAGLNNPKIVQYVAKENVLANMLFGESEMPKLPTEALNTLQSPKFMAIWKAD